jgi:aminoglycoside phosphotransferase (APT) family kinase protein
MIALDLPPFEIARVTKRRLLGEGLWGRIYDLGDGTVVKIAPERCAGIGSGRQKIESECAALTFIAAMAKLSRLVPVASGHGDIPASSLLAKEGFACWLRMTKMQGRHLGSEDIERLDHRQQAIVGRNIGVALAYLHKGLGDALPQRTLSVVEGAAAYATISDAARQLADPLYTDAVSWLVEARRRVPSHILARPSHGDFNISNLLFSRDCEVCAILDFAEWGADFPEKDISDVLHEMPVLPPDLITAYERVSGFRIDSSRIALGFAENALFGAVIGERMDQSERIKFGIDVAECRMQLTVKLEKLAL